MKVLKFGGGIILNPEASERMADIIKDHSDDDLMIVVSALNKMTNAFEDLVNAYMSNPTAVPEKLKIIRNYHFSFARGLFKDKNHEIFRDLDRMFTELETYLQTPTASFYNFEYDQIVSYGEQLSSAIISRALSKFGVEHKLFDARDLVKTDSHFRAARLNTELTDEAVRANLSTYFREETREKKVALTQGFIGSSVRNETTTLGREGSDFTAAILAFVLNASEVIIWKDVPGILTADPALFKDARKIDRLSYHEAMMMAYYGAKVVHPKTIRPLQRKNIPLYVRSFYNLEGEGTKVHGEAEDVSKVTSFMVKKDQALLSVFPSEFSFITSEDISKIFSLLHKYALSVNFMQNTAFRFSFCITDNIDKTGELLKNLDASFKTECTKGLEVTTIRHYTEEDIEKVTLGKNILMEQRSYDTAQFVIKSGEEDN